MTRLPDLERQLTEAAERQHRASTQASPGRRAGAARRAPWRRRGTGLLAGALVLGAVATGSAQVVGLDPLGLTPGSGAIDPQYQPSADADAPGVVVASGGAQGDSWTLRAWQARNGKVCVTGGGEGIFSCVTSEQAAALVSGTRVAGGELVGIIDPEGAQMAPRRLLAWALTSAEAPPPSFTPPAGARVARRLDIAPPLPVTVDHSTDGLSAAGRRLLATLPRTLSLRLTVAELRGNEPFTRNGDVIAVATLPRRPVRPTTVTVTTARAWDRAHSRPRPGTALSGVLTRATSGVAATARQRATYPVLDRPRRAGDAIPRSAMNTELRSASVDPLASRKLDVTGGGGSADLWIAPAAFEPEFTVPGLDGKVCLAGSPVLARCLPTPADGTRIAPEVVFCSPGLPDGQLLLWALPPAWAEAVTLTTEEGAEQRFPAGDLLVVQRSRTAALPKRLTWTGPGGRRAVDALTFAREAPAARCGRGQDRYWDLRFDAGGYGESHRD